MKLRKGFKNLLIGVNVLLLFTLGNNDVVMDLILTIIFCINSELLLKYGGLNG